jgi:hypothetical protein
MSKTEVWLESGEVFIARESSQQINSQGNPVLLTDDATGEARSISVLDILRVTDLVDSSTDLPNTHWPGGNADEA